jgi:hypothetical protein
MRHLLHYFMLQRRVNRESAASVNLTAVGRTIVKIQEAIVSCDFHVLQLVHVYRRPLFLIVFHFHTFTK